MFAIGCRVINTNLNQLAYQVHDRRFMGADQLRLRERHKDMLVQELVAISAVERLHPFLLTTISTVAG